MNENPNIKPIKDIIGENFFIPRYQRGYRWGEQEITELLEDIKEYYKLIEDRESKVSKFYCLQPIVVRKKEWNDTDKSNIQGWEVIDGQQRLTTIYLILYYLKDLRKFQDKKESIFNLFFETRPDSQDFFKKKLFVTENGNNIDFFYISKAFKTISNWFDKNTDYTLPILQTILKEEYNISVIWYEVEGTDENSIELFTRINEGKIPLTDAELIKALILQSDRYPENEKKYIKQRLFEIATEWDNIEQTLNDDKFWFFINDLDYTPSSKIEFIFKILAKKWNNKLEDEAIKRNSKHFEYIVFDRYLKKIKKQQDNKNKKSDDSLKYINQIWKDVKDVFDKLYEWYNDHTLYHLIGYLFVVTNDKEELLKELLELKLSKKEFKKNLRIKIAEQIKIKKYKNNAGLKELKQLKNLRYGEDDNEIRKILLLFNVDTLLNHSKEEFRFPFHLYKKQKISSIEHIHPQNPEKVDANEDRAKIWLESHKESIKSLKVDIDREKERDKLFSKIESLLTNFIKDEFENLYNDIIDFYTNISEIKENEVHTLYNLALVDKDTNSALNNSFFDIKREILKKIELSKEGKYIPICTQRVFTKYYSTNPTEMIFWSDKDRKAYFEIIENLYNSYLNIKSKTNE